MCSSDLKICTGFHPLPKVKEIFDAYRDEASRIGRKVGPDDLALRRQITIDASDAKAQELGKSRRVEFQKFIQVDPRVPAPGRQVLDTPSAHAFTIGDDEFVIGAPHGCAEQIIAQCREIGAGHFLGIFDRGARGAEMARLWKLFGEGVNPLLRQARIG